jgi:hypothetical protein
MLLPSRTRRRGQPRTSTANTRGISAAQGQQPGAGAAGAGVGRTRVDDRGHPVVADHLRAPARMRSEDAVVQDRGDHRSSSARDNSRNVAVSLLCPFSAIVPLPVDQPYTSRNLFAASVNNFRRSRMKSR